MLFGCMFLEMTISKQIVAKRKQKKRIETQETKITD